MNEVKKVVNTDQTAVEADGTVVNERAEAVSTKTDSKTTIVNVIWYIYGLFAIILAMRFVLKLTGANPANSFVDFIYSVSGVLSAPFDSIFGVTKATGTRVTAVFEPSILVAIAVYALVAWGISKLLALNEPKTSI